MTELSDALARALAARADLITHLGATGTDCYRLFHGTVEGLPGVTVDRYGDLLLVQSFHVPLSPASLAELEAWYRTHHPVFTDVVFNDRSVPYSRIRNGLEDGVREVAERERTIQELGVRYQLRARHGGQDPWLFLDLRAARRHVQQTAAGKSVLNLFAYTCGVGVCAAKAGATRVLNVDFAHSGLAVGRSNAALNGVEDRVQFLESDFFPAARQLAGLGLPRARHGHNLPVTAAVEPESFDLVFLDPPPYAKSAFGIVDLVQDYGGVFKPSLLATREGGEIVCCHNVAGVDVGDWVKALEGGVRRNRRSLRRVDVITPDLDFPSPDGRPPLKIAVLGV